MLAKGLGEAGKNLLESYFWRVTRVRLAARATRSQEMFHHGRSEMESTVEDGDVGFVDEIGDESPDDRCGGLNDSSACNK